MERRHDAGRATSDGAQQLTALGRSVDAAVHGIAQSVGGWWAAREDANSVNDVTFEDDVVYRAHYDFSPTRLADRSYEVVRPAYLVGHIAGANPQYAGKQFEEIEHELRSGWSDDLRTKHGEWEAMRQYAKEAYGRRKQRVARASGEIRQVRTDDQTARDANGDDATA
jgi:hypothetical protein